jgi:tetratricopeptide (TPR) repeat protein
VDLGNLLSSAGKHDEALALELEAEETRKKIPNDDDAIKSTGVIHQNIARCHTWLGQFEEAKNRLEIAIKQFEGSENWAMLA